MTSMRQLPHPNPKRSAFPSVADSKKKTLPGTIIEKRINTYGMPGALAKYPL